MNPDEIEDEIAVDLTRHLVRCALAAGERKMSRRLAVHSVSLQ